MVDPDDVPLRVPQRQPLLIDLIFVIVEQALKPIASEKSATR